MERDRQLDVRFARGNVAFVYQDRALIIPQWFLESYLYPGVTSGSVSITYLGNQEVAVRMNVSGLPQQPSVSLARKLVRLYRQEIDPDDHLYSLVPDPNPYGYKYSPHSIVSDIQNEVKLAFFINRDTREFLEVQEFPTVLQPEGWNYTRPRGKRSYADMTFDRAPVHYPEEGELEDPGAYYVDQDKYIE